MGERLDQIEDNIAGTFRGMTLERIGLGSALITVILAIICAIFVIFMNYGVARVFATLTIIMLAIAYVTLTVDKLFAEAY